MQQTSKLNKTVLAIVGLSIAFVFGGFAPQTFAQETNFMPYGSIGQEDELAVYHDGFYWVNTGSYLGVGNGQFMKITDLDEDYSIDQAIERFGIDEDIESFVVQPSLYSDATFLFELDNDLQFQMVKVFEAI